MKLPSDLMTDEHVQAIHRNELYPAQQCVVLGVLMLTLICLSLTGCGGKPAEASASSPGSITPRQFADGDDAGMMDATDEAEEAA